MNVKLNLQRQTCGLLAALLLGASLLAGCTNGSTSSSSSSGSSSQSATRVITDLAGRKVTIPNNAQKLATLGGPAYEKVLLLGGEKRIALTMPVTDKWALKLFPTFAKADQETSFQNPNVEDLLSRNIQMVFFWDTPQPLKKMTDANIPVIVTQQSTHNPSSAKEFRSYAKKEVDVFANALGGQAPSIAKEWKDYFDQKVAYVTSRTSKLTEAQKPKVYYVRGPSALISHGRNSYTEWYVEMAGGTLVTKDSKEEMMTYPTIEDVVKWNPDYIFMGRVNNTALIYNDPQWQNIKAVQDKHVYVNPDGVCSWDYGSQGVLLMEYIAKTLHPDLFKDLDMAKEVKSYYLKFYHVKLSNDDVQRILAHQTPAQ